jgi:hypothetical protein
VAVRGDAVLALVAGLIVGVLVGHVGRRPPVHAGVEVGRHAAAVRGVVVITRADVADIARGDNQADEQNTDAHHGTPRWRLATGT